jgi:hypothetical protein
MDLIPSLRVRDGMFLLNGAHQKGLFSITEVFPAGTCLLLRKMTETEPVYETICSKTLKPMDSVQNKLLLLIIRVTKSRRMRWEKHVARMVQMRNAYKIAVRKPEEKITRKT